MADTELWLVRHGQTAYNLEQRWQGQVDVPLDKCGEAQARQLTSALRGQQFDQVVSSDLGRALTTARLSYAGACASPEPALREMSFGQCEGLTYAEIVAKGWGDLFEKWHKNPMDFCLPGGETFRQLCDRVRGWYDREAHGQRTLVFAHGGTIRAFFHTVSTVADLRRFDVKVANTSVTVLAGDNPHDLKLLRLGDTEHLA